MEKKVINKATSDKISFMTYIVPAFADAYKMNVKEAWLYLKNTVGGTFSKNIGGRCILTAPFGQ